MLEKATEMGVTAFYPIQTQRTERTKLKPERLERILVAATKQSLKGKVPVVQPLQDFKSLLEMPFSGNKMIAHCLPTAKKPLMEVADNYLPALVCIGPEGDFTEEEIALAMAKDFMPISLGNSRLRTETAALATVSAFYHKFQE
jgi:16S rRNA (uracil1498-N3)-methyltransferase